MHVMTFETPLTGGQSSEVSTCRTASTGDHTSAVPTPRNEPAANATEPAADADADADASGSGRSLKLRKVFSRSRRGSSKAGSGGNNNSNNNSKSTNKRGSFISLSSFRSSIRSSFASGNLSDSDDDEGEHDFDDLTPRPPSRRRRSSLLRMPFSSSGGRRGSSGHSSIGSAHSPGPGSGAGPERRRSSVHRKSSLDLLRGSVGSFRPRAEHPLLAGPVPEEESKAKRRSSFLGSAMQRMSSTGNLRTLLAKTKSSGGLASTSSPLMASSSDHGPQSQQRKGSFFGSLRRGSSGREEPDAKKGEDLASSAHW